MASKQSVYEHLIGQQKQKNDFGDAFGMIIQNPYRILGASTFCNEEELQKIYKKWESNPDGFKSKFDKTKLGAPNRTEENMRWAIENADSYAYKLFWFSDPDIAVKLGNKSEFIDFFAKKQDVNSTDYNSFLAQYLFLCFYDNEFAMKEQWGVILNLINGLLNLSAGRFWGFFSGNKIEAIDNNKMAFLYNEFKDNILSPIKEIINKSQNINLEYLLSINSIINQVNHPQPSFARLQNILYEGMEKWFIKESEYVNNVLLSNVTSVNVSSLEEKLAIIEAYNYIMNDIVPNFHIIVDNIIPTEHSMNTRLRMMFSGKFIVVSKILSNAGMYHESLRLCQAFNEMFEDEYISTEISNLSKILRQEEKTRMSPYVANTAKGRGSSDTVWNDSDDLKVTEFGELEKLQNEIRKDFFQKKGSTGIDYKEVIQEVIENELKLVNKEHTEEKEAIPYIDKMAEQAAAEAEAEALRLKTAMEAMQKQHELELNTKMEALNMEYRQSMKALMLAVVVIIVTALILTGVMAFQFISERNKQLDENSFAIHDSETVALQTEIKVLDGELTRIEDELTSLSLALDEASRLYYETNDSKYLDEFTLKKSEYNELRSQYDEKVVRYNELKEKYKSTK